MVISAAAQHMHSPTAGTVVGIMVAIAGAGAVGGFINALLSDKGSFQLPGLGKKGTVQFGFISNVLLGTFAAVTTWGLYGPLKDMVLIGANPGNALPANLTLTALAGAAVAGAGGAKVISSQVDKSVLKKTAVEAAKRAPSATLAATIATSATPSAALTAVMKEPVPESVSSGTS